MELKLKDKYMLTIQEEVFYLNIGTKIWRRIAEDHSGNVFIFCCGNRLRLSD